MGTILRKYIEPRTWIADTCYHLESAFMKAWKLNICKTNSESDILLLYFLPQFLSLHGLFQMPQIGFYYRNRKQYTSYKACMG